MSSPEDGSKLKAKPILRDSLETGPIESSVPEPVRPLRAIRPQETVARMNVEYFDRREPSKKSPVEVTTRPRKKRPFNRRADQLGIFLLILTAILVALLFLGLYLSGRAEAHKRLMERIQAGEKAQQTPPGLELSLKEGNKVFNQVFAEEKALISREGSSSGAQKTTVVQDLGISAREQMKIMEQKTTEIRSLMSAPDSGTNSPVTPVSRRLPVKAQPVDAQNFNAPASLDSMLSKPLQQTNSP